MTARYSYGILELLRDVGGLGAVLQIGFNIVLPLYGKVRIAAIISSRAYFDHEGGDGKTSQKDLENNF